MATIEEKRYLKNDSRLCIIPVLVIMCYVMCRVENNVDKILYFEV